MHEEKFGAFVRRKREDKGISLRCMAKQVGVSPTYLSMVERGVLAPPAEDKIEAIASIVVVDIRELMGRAQRVPSDVSEIIKRNPLEITLLLQTIDGLDGKDISKVARKIQKWRLTL